MLLLAERCGITFISNYSISNVLMKTLFLYKCIKEHLNYSAECFDLNGTERKEMEWVQQPQLELDLEWSRNKKIWGWNL